MFLRIVQARCTDEQAVRRLWKEWADAAATISGWLGSTGGVTREGTLFLLSRYDSAQAARAHADSAQHAAWLEAAGAGLDGAPTVRETADVHAVGDPEPAEAGFLQIMEARVADRRRWEEIEEGLADAFTAHRPDFVGGYRAWVSADRVCAVDYFTSEAEARAGEAKPPPPDLQAGFEQWIAMLDEIVWHNIADPWIATVP
ncbi:MAG TPA: hypothetical protein VM324_16500 [Egibacteraceae bacterium]|jgi:quinol monooxygenase YgiN|nr:hypothetical protein [Egibacteraceae bacterium]